MIQTSEYSIYLHLQDSVVQMNVCWRITTSLPTTILVIEGWLIDCGYFYSTTTWRLQKFLIFILINKAIKNPMKPVGDVFAVSYSWRAQGRFLHTFARAMELIHFPKRCSSTYTHFRMMDKVQKPNNSESLNILKLKTPPLKISKK
jgi:hypothetical protein